MCKTHTSEAVHGNQEDLTACANPLCSKPFKRTKKTKEFCTLPCHDSFHKICREIGFKILTAGRCITCFGRRQICTGIILGIEHLDTCPDCKGQGTNVEGLIALPYYLSQYLSSTSLLGDVDSMTITFNNCIDGIKLISNKKEKP